MGLHVYFYPSRYKNGEVMGIFVEKKIDILTHCIKNFKIVINCDSVKPSSIFLYKSVKKVSYGYFCKKNTRKINFLTHCATNFRIGTNFDSPFENEPSCVILSKSVKKDKVIDVFVKKI